MKKDRLPPIPSGDVRKIKNWPHLDELIKVQVEQDEEGIPRTFEFLVAFVTDWRPCSSLLRYPGSTGKSDYMATFENGSSTKVEALAGLKYRKLDNG